MGFEDAFVGEVRVHIRTVRSSEQDTSRLHDVPEGFDVGFSKSMHHTVDVWPFNTAQHDQSSTSSLYRRIVSS